MSIINVQKARGTSILWMILLGQFICEIWPQKLGCFQLFSVTKLKMNHFDYVYDKKDNQSV